MSSIRTRLTAAFAAALMGTMIAFAAALWATRRAGSYDELRRHVAAEANIALGIIRQAELSGQEITVIRDSLVGPVVTPTLRTLLEGMPDYVLVLDRSGLSLYRSDAVRQLDSDALGTLLASAISAPTTGTGTLVRIGDERVLLVARASDSPKSAVSRVVVAASTRSADLAISELLGTMLVIAPLLLLASIAIAYIIAGRAFRPVDLIINEVQAITDGRSLHRRLHADGAGDELARLAETLNEMMERLEKSFAALRRFTADASHELKTPLAVLRADVERAMSPRATETEKLVALEEALHEITRMADLVGSLLTLARADEGRFDLHREPVALDPLVHEVFETAVILGEEAGLDVRMPAVEPATVLGDRTRLRQLLLNLITNAVKYTGRGGMVEVTLSRHDRTVTFAVRDTGIGISAEDLPHIFQRFYRADRVRTRTSERAGFGLGLSIAQWIAEAHGGTIEVHSRLGRGSIFRVTLPVADVPAASEPADPAALPAAS